MFIHYLLQEVGYQHGKTYFAGLKLAGKIPFGKQEPITSHRKLEQQTMYPNLVQMISSSYQSVDSNYFLNIN